MAGCPLTCRDGLEPAGALAGTRASTMHHPPTAVTVPWRYSQARRAPSAGATATVSACIADDSRRSSTSARSSAMPSPRRADTHATDSPPAVDAARFIASSLVVSSL